MTMGQMEGKCKDMGKEKEGSRVMVGDHEYSLVPVTLPGTRLIVCSKCIFIDLTVVFVFS